MKLRRAFISCIALIAVIGGCMLAAPLAGAQTTANTIKQRGTVDCGISPSLAGFSATDASGRYRGIDVDICRATAAALLGDSEKVKYVPVSSADRFTTLQSGAIDILSAASSWTYTRNTALALEFVAVNFYTGSAFLVRKSLNVTSAKQLDGATICDTQGTTNEHAVADFNKLNNIKINLLVFDDLKQVLAAMQSGRCDGYVNDTATDAVLALQLRQTGNEFVVLPEIISNNPQGPFVRQGDEQFYNLVKFSYLAMINAEALEITSSNVDELRAKSNDPRIRKFLGVDQDLCRNIGLDKECFYRIVKQVGNYEESYERNVGSGSILKIPRGVNALWTKGGLIFSPPFD